jgi:hypothetical protein
MRIKTTLTSFFLLTILQLCAQAIRKSTPPAKLKDFEQEATAQYIKYHKIKDDTARVRLIKQRNDTIQIRPSYFYIKEVEADSSINNDSIGFFLQPKSVQKQALTLEKGTISFFTNYLNQYVAKNDTLYPIVLKVKKISITEKRVESIYDEGKLVYEYEFIYKYKDKPIRLSGYSGSSGLQVVLGGKKPYDSLIYNSLHDILPQIDEQFPDMINNNAIFCKGIRTQVHLQTQSVNFIGDTLFYNENHALSWDDYKGITSSEDQMASYMGILFKPESDYKNGYLSLRIRIGACFMKNMSPAGDLVRRDDILNHEQYKFKILWYYTQVLKKKLNGLQLSPENFDQEISNAYNEINEKMRSDSNRYDEETRFGTKKKEQSRWEKTIDNELRTIQ